MNITFKEPTEYYATLGENDFNKKGPYKTYDIAVRTFANSLGGNYAPFFVHTTVEAEITIDPAKFISWIANQAAQQGLYGVDAFNKITSNPKAIQELGKDINNALFKAFATVQSSNKIALSETRKVYPRDYIDNLK